MFSAQDEGTSVRKRVLKLLRDIYQKGLKSDLEEDHKMIVDASLKLLGRVTEDDEETVRVGRESAKYFGYC